MKKYGIYVGCSGSNNGEWLIQEFNTLKEAVREAFRLSRCKYHHSDLYLADTFIVCDNTGITLNRKVAREYVRYFVATYIVFDDIISFLYVEGQQTFLVKVGIV